MTRLSVNVNKIATLRNARGGSRPHLLKMVRSCIQFGAQGITVHPRPDERHIKYTDVFDISGKIEVEFNIEGYPSETFLKMVEEVKPEQCTLVPDPPGVLTSNAGWDTLAHASFLSEVTQRLRESGVRSSLFLGTEKKMLEGAKACNTDRVELYTGPYASLFKKNPEASIKPFVEAGKLASELELGLNAGHDLDLNNLRYFKNNVTQLLEVSIGHALVCDALYLGMEETVKRYLKELE